MNYVSHIDSIDSNNYIQKIHDCVHVKNALGYSNYFHTGENDLTDEDVIETVDNISSYCEITGKQLGLTSNSPYYEIMEVSGYDYDNLTAKLVVRLIDGLALKEVKSNEKGRVLKKSWEDVWRTSLL